MYLQPITPHIPAAPQATYVYTKCQTCDIIPAKFTVAEIHHTIVVMTYPAQWFIKDYFPTVNEIRAYIWQLSNKQTALIEHCKRSAHYEPHSGDRLQARLQWFKVYLRLRSVLDG